MTKRRGNCYVTCEALYYLLGGKAAGWTPHTVRHEGDVHWYLQQDIYENRGNGRIERVSTLLDPTAQQFINPPPYHLGRGRGFLTREPSRRARGLMERMLWQSAPPSAARKIKRGSKR